MDAITPMLSEALDSIRESNEWGGTSERIEDVLAPDDWRLIEIKAFRRRLIMYERTAEEDVFRNIRTTIRHKYFPNVESKIFYLRKFGLNNIQISKIIRKDKSFIDSVTFRTHIPRPHAEEIRLAEVQIREDVYGINNRLPS